MSRSRLAAGFTLIELLVVLLIIGIALAVVAPRLPVPRSRPSRASRKLLAQVAAGRVHAAVTGKNVTVLWGPDTAGGFLQISPTGRCGGATAGRGEIEARHGYQISVDRWTCQIRFKAVSP